MTDPYDQVPEPLDCGHCYACLNDAGACHNPRSVGTQAEPVAYTPPKYGPPPGMNPEKWRTMNRKQRRDRLKAIAKSINTVARQPKGD